MRVVKVVVMKSALMAHFCDDLVLAFLAVQLVTMICNPGTTQATTPRGQAAAETLAPDPCMLLPCALTIVNALMGTQVSKPMVGNSIGRTSRADALTEL